jgi:hypothetical protein
MKNWIPVTVVVALLASGGYWLFTHPVTVSATPAIAASAPPSSHNATAAPSTDNSAAPGRSAAAESMKKPSDMQATASSLNSAGASSSSAVALTRVIDPLQTLQIGERTWAVLGTRDVAQGNRKQTVLVLRDEASGQLDYRQSALRFVLRPDEDYEAFIRERRNAQRLFVNVLYGEMAVDAAYIAAEYTTLSSDKRVVKVQFMPLVVPARPR